MNKNLLAIIIGISLGLIGSLVMLSSYTNKRFNDIYKTSQQSQFRSTRNQSDANFTRIELADEELERQKGLMFRQELCDRCAMLFVFPQQQNLSFFMKNTYISLDIIFLDSNGTVINVAEYTTPLQVSPTYNSAGSAKYVIEVNGGFTSANSINSGYNFDIKKLISTSIDYDNSFTFQSKDSSSQIRY